jgi:signal transduction histidine kinase/CheY-like chemotaxis protein
MTSHARSARLNYRFRSGSFLLLFVILGAHLLARGGDAWLWGLAVLQCLVYPQLLYGYTLRTSDLRRTDLNSLLLDAFLFGLWSAALGFPAWISFTLHVGALVNNGIYRGLRGVGLSLLASALGILLGLGLWGFHLQPQTDGLTTALCMFSLALYLALLVGLAHARNQTLYDTRAQLRDSEQALQQANRGLQQQIVAKARFLAYAGHDLRQPLQAMQLFLSSLAHAGLDEKQGRLLHMAQSSADALSHLLDSLLNISKLDAGAIKPELRALDVDILLTTLVQEFEAQALDKGLRLRLWLPAETVTVLSDEKLLISVLRNLIDNAVAHTRQGGVLVALRRRGAAALVQVWDSGPGIAQEDLPRIYEEFYQADNPQRDRAQGLGLGLSIVRRMSNLLGLGIVCHSRLGRGTVMSLTLPVFSGARGVVPLAEPPAGAAADLRGLHVVLVEDSVEVAAAQRAWLDACQAQVSCFGSAQEALAHSEVLRRADFFLCDYRLPGGFSGIDFLNAVQARCGRKINAALLTGDTSAAFIAMAAASGWPVLFKPVAPSRLLQVLAQARTT